MEGGVEAKKLEAQLWSDLPLDIINEIANRLYYVDQLQFRAVCKNWRAAEITQCADKLPWLMIHTLYVCYLFDPFHKQLYTVVSGDSIRGEIFVKAAVFDTKYGWVLFSAFCNTSASSSVFFYTPFTGKIIELPNLHNHRIRNATFSNAPDSPDCVICAVSIYSEKYCISICRPGDLSWKEFWFDGKHEYCSNLVYVDGFFYCDFRAPGLLTVSMGAFNVASETWHSIPTPPWCNITLTLIESDGKLLLCDHVSGYRVLIFNRARKDWFETDSLDDRALFMGSQNLSVSVGKASPLANTIHHFDTPSYADNFHLLWKPPERDYLGEFLTFGPKISDYQDCKLKNLLGVKTWVQPPKTRH